MHRASRGNSGCLKFDNMPKNSFVIPISEIFDENLVGSVGLKMKDGARWKTLNKCCQMYSMNNS
jgi:hypothetical protein